MTTRIPGNTLDRLAAKTFGMLKTLAAACVLFAAVAALGGEWMAALKALKASLFCITPVLAPALAMKLFHR